MEVKCDLYNGALLVWTENKPKATQVQSPSPLFVLSWALFLSLFLLIAPFRHTTFCQCLLKAINLEFSLLKACKSLLQIVSRHKMSLWLCIFLFSR